MNFQPPPSIEGLLPIAGVRMPRAGLVLLLLLWVLPPSVAASTNRHVVLITIDGLAAYNLSDSRVSMPTLRRLAAEGAVAEGLRVSNPTVTWPNHTTLVTGVHPAKHSVLFNGLLLRRGPGEAVVVDGSRDQQELVAVPTVYDLLHRAGYRTASINWPCTRGATTLDDNVPDVPGELAYTTPRLRAELKVAGILASTDSAEFVRLSAAGRDRVWTGAACHLIRSRRPHLLLLHLLVTDVIQHRYGPGSPAAHTALALADAHVAEVVEALGRAGMSDRTTVVIASDHGFDLTTKLVNPAVVLRKAGLSRPGPRRRAQVISEGGTAFVYLTSPATIGEDRAKVTELLRGHEGIAEILGPDQFEALHLPDPARNPQMADLVLVASEGFAFADNPNEEEAVVPLTSAAGSHGHLATNPRMNGVLVVWGRGIKAGMRMGIVDNIDVAPTVAAILGQKFTGVDGRARMEIMAEAGR